MFTLSPTAYNRAMYITKEVYQQIIDSYPLVPPENGGIIGSRNGIVFQYLHDYSGQPNTIASYQPNTEWMNQSIDRWSDAGVVFAGILHSHPQEQTALSQSDRLYITQIMRSLPESINRLFFPVVIPGKRIISFTAVRRGNQVSIQPDAIELV